MRVGPFGWPRGGQRAPDCRNGERRRRKHLGRHARACWAIAGPPASRSHVGTALSVLKCRLAETPVKASPRPMLTRRSSIVDMALTAIRGPGTRARPPTGTMNSALLRADDDDAARRRSWWCAARSARYDPGVHYTEEATRDGCLNEHTMVQLSPAVPNIMPALVVGAAVAADDFDGDGAHRPVRDELRPRLAEPAVPQPRRRHVRRRRAAASRAGTREGASMHAVFGRERRRCRDDLYLVRRGATNQLFEPGRRHVSRRDGPRRSGLVGLRQRRDVRRLRP